jgi:hypothetical protein
VEQPIEVTARIPVECSTVDDILESDLPKMMVVRKARSVRRKRKIVSPMTTLGSIRK